MACFTVVPPDPEPEAVRWVEAAGAPSRAASADEPVPDDPTAQWRRGLSKPASGPPAVGARVIAVASVDRWLTLINRTDGERIWRARLDDPAAGEVLIAGDRLYAATNSEDGRVYAYALHGGRRHWHRRVGPVAGSLALVGNRVLAVTDQGVVTALEVDRGAVLWRRALGGPSRTGVAPLDDGALVATTFDSVFVLAADDGAVRARAALPGAVLGTPAIVEGQIILGSPDGLIAALDAADLSVRWRVRTGAGIVGGVAVARDTAWAVTTEGTLYGVPLARPSSYDSVMLEFTVIALPVPVADGVLVSGAGGEVVLVSRATPAGRTLFRVDGPIRYPVVVRDRTIYVADGRGRVEAWR